MMRAPPVTFVIVPAVLSAKAGAPYPAGHAPNGAPTVGRFCAAHWNPTCAFRSAHLMILKMLYALAPSSIAMASRIRNSFAMPRFTLANPGPIRLLRWVLPNVPLAGSTNAAGLNQLLLDAPDTLVLPTCSGNKVPAFSPGSI